MSRRYHGRRAHRERGVSPIMILIALLVAVAAAFLLWGNLKKDRAPKTDEPIVEDPSSEQTAEPAEPEEPPIAAIPLTGEPRSVGGVLVVGNTAYELYTYVDESARKYATCVSKVADDLAGTADVYSVVAPLSSGVTLPDELFGREDISDQKAAEQSIFGYMSGNVHTVPLYDTMMQHRTEYVYFRTDHHWTGLGAYYAYTQLCTAAGLPPHEISAYQTIDFDGFLGTFYNDAGSDPTMGATPDTVKCYCPVSANAPMTVTESSGNVMSFDSVIFDESTAPAGFKYGAFIYGDNPYTVINNADVTNGRSCVVIKDSFGNALVPFLVDHYQTVHVLDFRHWSGSITQFVRDNGVDDVIFCNNLSAIRNSSLIGDLYSVL